MKKLGSLLLMIVLAGCAKPIMPPIQYDKPIDLHINRPAILQWTYGKQCDASIPRQNGVSCGTNDGVLGAVISIAANAAVQSYEANNPSQNCASYGKAEQAIFMTSFKDVLNRQQVFKEVELIMDDTAIQAKDVLIHVYFKTARVSSAATNFRITLTVVMTIKSQGKAPFVRTYLVQSCPGSATFVDQQYDVSARLLEKLIAGIEEWHKSKK